MRWFPALLCLLLSTPVAAEITLTQSSGDKLVLGAPARRIITLAPNLTELVYAAGAEAHLVATVKFSDYPPAAKQVNRIGDAFRVDLERLLALRPDLVIAWATGNPAALLQRLEDLGLLVWRTEISSLTHIPELIEAIGTATGSLSAARSAAADFNNRLETLKANYANRAQVRYFYQVDQRPLFTVNGKHLISRALALCGGQNVFAGINALAPSVTIEAVVAANPEVLLAPDDQETEKVLAHWLSWQGITAVARGNLFYLDADQISRATPRILAATEQACLHLQHVRDQKKTPQQVG